KQALAARAHYSKTVGGRGPQAEVRAQFHVLPNVVTDPELKVTLDHGDSTRSSRGEEGSYVGFGKKAALHLDGNPLQRGHRESTSPKAEKEDDRQPPRTPPGTETHFNPRDRQMCHRQSA